MIAEKNLQLIMTNLNDDNFESAVSCISEAYLNNDPLITEFPQLTYDDVYKYYYRFLGKKDRKYVLTIEDASKPNYVIGT